MPKALNVLPFRARSLARKVPKFPIQSNAAKRLLGLIGRLGTPLRAQSVRIPLRRQLPALLQAQHSSPRTLPLAAPAVDMLFRPEQEHGLSGENNVLVPIP